MRRYFIVIALLAGVIALPFVFRRHEPLGDWRPGDPVLVVISPHNEAIRHEFGRAFAAWHMAHYGRPVRIDWRALGGTTEILRYLSAEYVNAFRAWWRLQGESWPASGGAWILDRRFDAGRPPEAPDARAAWEQQRRLYRAFREIDDAREFGCRIDILFGGGVYDHGIAGAQGLTVPPWPTDAPPPDTLTCPEDGSILIPEAVGGEIWRSDRFFGAALSTFGIVYNRDRLDDLGITVPPTRWSDLADPRYFRQLGVADPTKSGSIAKAFEMIIHEQCRLAVEAAGFDTATTADFERRIAAAGGSLPPEVPSAYQQAIESGWETGLFLVQLIGANARYFTDSAGKVPVDVSMGNAAAGVAIDFYGRYQAEVTTPPGGSSRMVYVTPVGGSSVSADPISVLRGAPDPELARRFMTFVLGTDGQRLWNYRVGAPGGPRDFALRRLPIRRDFYPHPGNPRLDACFAKHQSHAVDNLGAADTNPYALANTFHYHARWTASHFGVHRYLIRAMCMDAGDELRTIWKRILESGGPEAQPEAMARLRRLPDIPEPLTWQSAPAIVRAYAPIDFMREWTRFFRTAYREAHTVLNPVAITVDGHGRQGKKGQ